MRPYSVHYLAGLPRSGSTVIGAILNQHPQIHCSLGSGMVNVMEKALDTHASSLHCLADHNEERATNVVLGVMTGFYAHVSKPFVIDKNRYWADPRNMRMIKRATGRPPKVLCPVRPLVEILASWVLLLEATLDKSSQHHDNVFVRGMRHGNFALTREGLCAYMVSDGCVGDAMRYMRDGVASEHFQSLCVLDYGKFVADPQHTMNKVHAFIGVDRFGYDFNNIETKGTEDDLKAYGVPGIHTVFKQLTLGRKGGPRDILGTRLYDFYKEFKI